MTRVAISFFFILLSFFPHSVVAHESKQSGDTIVFVHVNPSDQAVVNKKGTFYILITKNRYQFPIEECDCSVTVLDASKKELSMTPFTGELGKALVPYLFAKSGIHTVRVDGNPKEGATFAPFSLLFDITVERGSIADMLQDKKVLYSLMGLILLLSFLGVYTKNYLIRKYKKS